MMPTWLLIILATVWFGLCGYAAYRWGRLLLRRQRFYLGTADIEDEAERNLVRLRRKSASLFFWSSLGLILWAIIALSTRGIESVWIELTSVAVLFLTPLVLARAGYLEDQHDWQLYLNNGGNPQGQESG